MDNYITYNNISVKSVDKGVCAFRMHFSAYDGDIDNIKLTTPHDIVIAEAIIKNRGDL